MLTLPKRGWFVTGGLSLEYLDVYEIYIYGADEICEY